MELWAGSHSQFVTSARRGQIADSLAVAYRQQKGVNPTDSEVKSWARSLDALAQTTREPRNDVGTLVEFHLPFSGQRIDVVFFGASGDAPNSALVVELKQWSEAELEDVHTQNVLVGGAEHVHPSQQALDYAEFLRAVHESFSTGRVTLQPCSFCHDLTASSAAALYDSRFAPLLAQSPMFQADGRDDLGRFIERHVGGGGTGIELMEEVRQGRFKPSQKVIDTVLAWRTSRTTGRGPSNHYHRANLVFSMSQR